MGGIGPPPIPNSNIRGVFHKANCGFVEKGSDGSPLHSKFYDRQIYGSVYGGGPQVSRHEVLRSASSPQPFHVLRANSAGSDGSPRMQN